MFLRKKTINGKEYYYIVKSTRQDGVVKKFERYVGINKPDADELKRLNSEFDSVKLFLSSKQENLEKIKLSYEEKTQKVPVDLKENFLKHFITKFTYDTSRIEGSSLSYKDTNLLLNEGITPSNKSTRDIREAENHKQAYLHMLDNNKSEISLDLILTLHRLLKQGISEDAGKLRNGQVYVADLIPVNHKMVHSELQNFIDWLTNNKDMHPIEKAAIFHSNFERIHPFFDGNGRIGRILLNFILIQSKYPPANIQNKNRRRYYNALHHADLGNYLYMIKYLMFELENLYL